MCPSSFWGFTKMQFQRNIPLQVMWDSILTCQASTMATCYMKQQTDMFLSVRFWVVLASKCRLLVSETWPELLPFTLCSLCKCMESAHLFWNIGSGSRKILNYTCTKKILRVMSCSNKKSQQRFRTSLGGKIIMDLMWLKPWPGPPESLAGFYQLVYLGRKVKLVWLDL